MKQLKKTLTLILALSMVLSAIPAFAAETQGDSSGWSEEGHGRPEFPKSQYGQVTVIPGDGIAITFDRVVRVEQEIVLSWWSEMEDRLALETHQGAIIYAHPECRMTVINTETGENAGYRTYPYRAWDGAELGCWGMTGSLRSFLRSSRWSPRPWRSFVPRSKSSGRAERAGVSRSRGMRRFSWGAARRPCRTPGGTV